MSRICCPCYHLYSPHHPILKQLHWLLVVKHGINLKIFLYTFKAFHLPSDWVHISISAPQILFFSFSLRCFPLSSGGSALLLDLPPDLRRITSFSLFRSRLKTHLIPLFPLNFSSVPSIMFLIVVCIPFSLLCSLSKVVKRLPVFLFAKAYS